MVASERLDPGWARRQGQAMLAAARAQQQTTRAISSAISAQGDAVMARWETMQETGDLVASRGSSGDVTAFSNYILGQETVIDPQYGEQHQVWSDTTSNHHWIDDSGTIVGTRLDQNPDPSRFRRTQPGW